MKTYTLSWERKGKFKIASGTIEELTQYFNYDLLCGNSYNRKINMKPKTIKSLISAINDSIDEIYGGYERPYVSLIQN